MNRWTICVVCMLCAASIHRSGDDPDELGEQCDAEARERNWLQLPKRDMPRRDVTWVCRECADDVLRLAS